MDLEQLKNFVHIADAGSFAGAARLSGMPKSTVSRKLMELEEALNVRLIERTTRQLRLTEDGLLLHSRAKPLMQEAKELSHLMTSRDETPSGLLRVNVPNLFGQVFMGRLCASFVERWPQCQIEGVYTDNLSNLIEEEVDCAIRIGILQDSTLVAQEFARSHMELVCAPKLLKSMPPCNHPMDLLAWPCVGFQFYGGLFPWRLTNGVEQVDVPVKPVITLPSMLSALDAAQHGGGVALLPDWTVQSAIEQGTLQRVCPAWHTESKGVYLVYPSRRHLSARVRAFRTILFDAFENKTFPPL